MSEKLCNLKSYMGGVLHSTDIANNLTTVDEGKVLDARQGKALNDQISSINTSLTQYCKLIYKLNNSGSFQVEDHTLYVMIPSGNSWGNYCGLYLLYTGASNLTRTIITVQACEHLETLTLTNNTVTFAFDPWGGSMRCFKFA